MTSLKISIVDGYNSGSVINSIHLKYANKYEMPGNIAMVPTIELITISRYCLLYNFASTSHGHCVFMIL